MKRTPTTMHPTLEVAPASAMPRARTNPCAPARGRRGRDVAPLLRAGSSLPLIEALLLLL